MYPALETTLAQTKHIKGGFRKAGIVPWDKKAVNTDKLKPGEAYVPQQTAAATTITTASTAASALSPARDTPVPALSLSPCLHHCTHILTLTRHLPSPGGHLLCLPRVLLQSRLESALIRRARRFLSDNTDQLEKLRTQSTELQARVSCAAEDRRELDWFVGAEAETERTCNLTAEMTAPLSMPVGQLQA